MKSENKRAEQIPGHFKQLVKNGVNMQLVCGWNFMNLCDSSKVHVQVSWQTLATLKSQDLDPADSDVSGFSYQG